MDSAVTYQTTANMLAGLRGVILAQPLETGTKVIVNGIEFQVRQCTKILISYAAAKKILTIRAGWRYYCHHGNRMKFLNACGYSSEREFMQDHMQNPVYVFGFAEAYRYFYDFYEPFY
jgi:hypothetical protein